MSRIWIIHKDEEKMGPYTSYDMDLIRSWGLLSQDSLVSISFQEPLSVEMFLVRSKSALEQAQNYLKVFFSKVYEEQRINKYNKRKEEMRKLNQQKYLEQQFPEMKEDQENKPNFFKKKKQAE